MRRIVGDFVAAINETAISWCHWKSNEHLEPALMADTDLDLLFSRGSEKEVDSLLKAIGYLAFAPPPYRTYPHIRDYLGLAEESGQLVHVQAHYALIAGEERLKNHILPWGDELLARRRPWDGNPAVWIADPADELVTLIARGALKIRARDHVKYRKGRRFGDADFAREFAWLQERVDGTAFRERACRLAGNETGELMAGIYDDGASLHNMTVLAKALRRQARQNGWQRLNAVHGRLQRWFNEALSLFAKAQRRIGLRRPWILRRRIRQTGGSIVALMGVDGSGKSTVTKAIAKDWGRKLDIELIYFGTGDGPKSLSLRLMALGRDRLMGRTDRKKTSGERSRGKNRGWPQIAWALSAARLKRREMRWAYRLRQRGVLVICDRYPQNVIEGFNDGPRLASLLQSKSFLKRMAAEYEARIYKSLAAAQPDLLIKLMPSLDVALARKPGDVPPAILAEKHATLGALEFAGIPTVTVDADQPLEAVLRKVKSLIWKSLPR